jgi:hypothetical protein
MKASRRVRPNVEALGAKTLLSVSAAVMPVVRAAMVAAAGRRSSPLLGGVSGTTSAAVTIPDAGRTTTLTGSGKVGPLGSVSAEGQFHAVGFIAQGTAEGTLTLSNSRGSVTVRLVGPPRNGFSALPTSYRYTISQGTGHDKVLRGSGVADLTLGTSGTDFTRRFER